METFILLTLILAVLLFPLANWTVNNYAEFFSGKKDSCFLISIVLAVLLALLLTVLSTDYAIKQVLLEYSGK